MQQDTWEYFWTTMRFDCGISNGEPVQSVVDRILAAFETLETYNEGAVMQALRDCYAMLDGRAVD